MTIRRSSLVLLSLVAASCGFLKRPENHFYSLDTIAASAPVAAVAGTPIGVDTIELPPGLDRRGIVLRKPDQQLEVRGTHQWASPLEEMVLHTLAFNLANRIPEGMVILPGQPKPSAPMRSLSVVFEDLAPGQDRVFILDARWTLATPAGAGETHHERLTVELQSLDSAHVAEGMSKALALLADRIVAQLGPS